MRIVGLATIQADASVVHGSGGSAEARDAGCCTDPPGDVWNRSGVGGRS